MILTLDIIHALKTKIESYGDYGQTKLSTEFNISKENISRWLQHDPAHKTKRITEPLWNKLYPAIKDFLKSEPAVTSNYKPNNESSKNINGEDLETLALDLSKLANGRQIVTGVINVGISNEKIIAVINQSDLTDKQKNKLITDIFS